jgi:hypothetical protein
LLCLIRSPSQPASSVARARIINMRTGSPENPPHFCHRVLAGVGRLAYRAQKTPLQPEAGPSLGRKTPRVICSVESLGHFDPAGCGYSHTASREGGGARADDGWYPCESFARLYPRTSPPIRVRSLVSQAALVRSLRSLAGCSRLARLAAQAMKCRLTGSKIM